MKNFFIIVLALIVGAGGGYFTWRYLASKSGGNNSRSERKVTLANYQEPFMWGINVNPSPVRNYSLEMWNDQMNFVTNLGTKWIRLVFDNNANNKFQIYDEMIESANSQGTNVLLSLDSSKPVTSLDKPYDDGYNVALEIAKHYKGKIHYYQVLNEVGGTAIKGSQYSGENESDFDQGKYEKIRDWSKGAVAAIRKTDPEAYIVIDFHWTHVAMVEKLLKDKVDFDIIGWNWYSDMKMMSSKKLSDGTLLVDKLKSFNKPVILAEVNGAPMKDGTNEQAQSDFIQQMADWAYGSGLIKGFYVHELVDIAPTANRKGGFFGLIKYKKASDGGYTYGDPKKAFFTYKNIITKYTK